MACQRVGRKRVTEKGNNLECREGAEMEERGRHRYGFLKDSGRLESVSRGNQLQQTGTGHL